MTDFKFVISEVEDTVDAINDRELKRLGGPLAGSYSMFGRARSSDEVYDKFIEAIQSHKKISPAECSSKIIKEHIKNSLVALEYETTIDKRHRQLLLISSKYALLAQRELSAFYAKLNIEKE